MEGIKIFTEITKFLDRNFIVAYLSPALIWLALSAAILEQLGVITNISIPHNSIDDIVLSGGIILFCALAIGIMFSSLNQDLYQLMEGYGTNNPLKLFSWMEKRRYQKVLKEVEKLDDEFRECINSKKEFPPESRVRRNTLMIQLAEEFPDKEEYLLPTPFGNVIRSFQIYPRYMYGLEAIDGWNRLLAVMPKDYLEFINTARARVDFWVNLGVVFMLLQIEYIVLAFMTSTPLQWWIVLLFIALGTLAPLRATSAAREWGDFVKSAFDVYRFKLLESLGINLPKDRDEEKVMWKKYSQAIIYRLPETLPDLKETPKPVTRKTKSK